MTTEKKSTYNHFCGIDVGKYELVLAFDGDKKPYSYSNDKSGIRSLWKSHKQRLSKSMVVVETTGWYEMKVMRYLLDKGVIVHRASARQVKQFIGSFGTLAKTDAMDAFGLARYAKERCELIECFSVPDGTQTNLRCLYERYCDLKKMVVQESNRLQAPGNELIHSSFTTVIDTMNQQVDSIKEKIRRIIAGDANLIRKAEVLETIDGVGEVTIIALLALMPELGKIDRKKIASLAGLAPHPKDSGSTKGYRKTRGGRPKIKEIMHMAALGAIRKKNGELKDFYQHLIDDNKKCKMVALTAVKRKIIIIANARIRDLEMQQAS